MKYLVIGAGGTGGSIGGFMTEAGKDIIVIAREKPLEAIQKNGLKIPHAQIMANLQAL